MGKERISVTEEMRPEKEWFEQACNMKMDDLMEFCNHMLDDYNHDYGTACHAVAACAIAAAWAASDKEGITGFQAGFVMWDFIRNWTKTCNKTGLRLIDYDDMLYPQYKEKFDKVISKDVWVALQEEARKNIKESKYAGGAVIEHWKSIAEGTVPFGYRVSDDD